MKTAKLHFAAVEFTCPVCNEHISCDSGSHMFLLYEIPEELECDLCKIKLKVPDQAKKLKGVK